MNIKQRLDHLEAVEIAKEIRAEQRKPQSDTERVIRIVSVMSESAARLGVPCTFSALAAAGDRMAQIFISAQQRREEANLAGAGQATHGAVVN
jgi:hypothetical protein